MSSHGGAGNLRIIGGEWRGRRLPVPDLPGLRPTADRNRETLFNWLAPEIAGRHCLDLFAGSGALGLEALSRGAASCVFVELQRKAADRIGDSLETLGANDRGSVRRDDGLNFIAREWPDPAPDLVFLDPPFASELMDDALVLLLPRMPDEALLYLEHARDRSPKNMDGWQCRRSKQSGDVVFSLYERA